MFDNSNQTSLNFNDNIVGRTLMDKKAGIAITFGYFSGLPIEHSDLMNYRRGLGLCLVDKGLGQGNLDRACRYLADACQLANFELLVTKSDMPFDGRWYLIGNIEAMIAAAEKDIIDTPLSSPLYEEIRSELERF